LKPNLQKDVTTFSFGENWKAYLKNASIEDQHAAAQDISEWLGEDRVKGRSVVDIGCGSGIHSLAFHRMGAKKVISFDADIHSVEATRKLWQEAGEPSNWQVSEGSILDKQVVDQLGQHDIVYSWGVLHHTGAMWEAMANAIELVQPGGYFWIAIYQKGPKYPKHLKQKIRYNKASETGKKLIVYRTVALKMLGRLTRLKNPIGVFRPKRRGMSRYHDIIDWLGGLPYEVASPEEVESFCQGKGLQLEKIKVRKEGSNNFFLFTLPG
jgi:2-polyprenyl-6-hydroxyphenyl methylase/3-demethylubiquinone-9 3-methyltransferase